jgi:hypothetical protein
MKCLLTNYLHLYRIYHSKRNPNQSRTEVQKWNRKRVIDSPSTPVTLESRSPWLLGRCSRQLRKRCARANMVYSRAERVFILEHYFASKSFAAVHEAFSNAYSDREVPNKTIIHRLVTEFRNTGSVCLWQVLIERQNSWNYDRTDFKQCISCNNGIRLQEFRIAIGS